MPFYHNKIKIVHNKHSSTEVLNKSNVSTTMGFSLDTAVHSLIVFGHSVIEYNHFNTESIFITLERTCC